MPLSVRQLQIIRAVIQTGSVTDAASALSISQPAVSIVLRDCAKVSGFPLFTRKQGRLQPTSETLALLPEIDRIFEGLDRVQQLVGGLRDIEVGFVSVAAPASLAENIVARAIAMLRASRATIDVALHTTNNADVASLVTTRRVDFGLVLAPVEILDTQATDLAKSELICVVAKDHPLAKRKWIEPRDLASYPLISFSRSYAMGALIDEVFRKKRVRRRISLEITQSSTARALAREGLGVAIVDSFYRLDDGSIDLKTVKFIPRTLQMSQVLMPKDGRISRPARLLLSSIRESAARLSKI